MTDISMVADAIESLVEEAGGAAQSFIEIRDNGKEVVLGGNRVGLLQIALQILALADRDAEGAHFHLDANSGADIAERPLVLRKTVAK